MCLSYRTKELTFRYLFCNETATTEKSTLTIGASGGAGESTVIDILVEDSLKAVAAPKIGLLGDLIVAGTLTTLQLGDVADNHFITVGPTVSSADTLTVTMSQVENLTFDSQTPIKSFTVVEWLDTDDDPDLLIAP